MKHWIEAVFMGKNIFSYGVHNYKILPFVLKISRKNMFSRFQNMDS